MFIISMSYVQTFVCQVFLLLVSMSYAQAAELQDDICGCRRPLKTQDTYHTHGYIYIYTVTAEVRADRDSPHIHGPLVLALEASSYHPVRQEVAP